MNVVFVRSNFRKLYLVPLLDSKARLFENFVNVLIDYSSSVLRRKHEVLQQYRDVVTQWSEYLYIYIFPALTCSSV